jgi:hypothetical protein
MIVASLMRVCIGRHDAAESPSTSLGRTRDKAVSGPFRKRMCPWSVSQLPSGQLNLHDPDVVRVGLGRRGLE